MSHPRPCPVPCRTGVIDVEAEAVSGSTPKAKACLVRPSASAATRPVAAGDHFSTPALQAAEAGPAYRGWRFEVGN